MTLREAIDRIDSLKHNTYTNREKVEWLSRLDALINIQIMGGKSFGAYDETKDMDTYLLVDLPYDDIYIRWLEAQIDYYNGEISRYNNSIAMYQEVYDTYQRWYNRTHIKKGQTLKF